MLWHNVLSKIIKYYLFIIIIIQQGSHKHIAVEMLVPLF